MSLPLYSSYVENQILKRVQMINDLLLFHIGHDNTTIQYDMYI